MTSQDFRERLLAVLMVALMVASAFPAVLVLGAGGGGSGDEGADQDGWSGSDDGHMWPMFARDAAHGGVADTYDRGLSSPGMKWDRNEAISSLGTVIGNFTGNVKATNASHTWDDQLHCAVFSTANQVHLVDADGEDMWVLNITGTFSAAPAIGDVDDDGRSDIVLATRTGVMYAYEPVIRWNGTRFTWWGDNTQLEQLWNTTGRTMGTVTTSNLVLDDLNSAGPDELLVGTSQGVFCLNARNGNEVWNHTVSGISISTPAVYNFGVQRNVVATAYNATPSPDQVHVYTLRGTDGAVLKSVTMEVTIALGTFIPPFLPFFPSPVTADLDGQADGDELIILQPYDDSIGRIIVFSDGDLDWTKVAYNKSLGGSNDLWNIAHATPVVADLEGDGTLDVVVASWKTYRLPLGTTATNVSVFKGASGARGWANSIDETANLDAEWAISSPVLMDADKDGTLDVVLVQYNGQMNCLSGKNGTLLWDLTTASLVLTSPAVGDLDMDGFPEVVVNSQAVSFLLPDLEVNDEDIQLSPATPEEGQAVNIAVSVHNRGNDDALNVKVSLWDNGVLVGNATISSIVAGRSSSASFNHAFYGRVDHMMRAVVDPDDEIEELREDNNEAFKAVSIISRYGLELDCPTNESIISPGNTKNFFCEASNVGMYHNRIKLTATGTPQDWTVTITPNNFLLGPAGSGNDATNVVVEVKTDPSSPAGPFPITVTAVSQNQTRNNDSVILTTVIKGQHGVFVSPADNRSSVASGNSVVYRFNATNIGNSVDSYALSYIVPPGQPDWQVEVFPIQISGLPSDGSKEVLMEVQVPYDASEGESLTAFLHIESESDPSRYAESRTVTNVVIPDIAVIGIKYLRGDGSTVDGTNKRLVVNEDSIIVARLANLRSNTDITSMRVRFTVDGVPSPVTGVSVPSEGVTEVPFLHTFSTTLVHSVEVIADPYESISDADRTNNRMTGSVDVKSQTPTGAFQVNGQVRRSDNVTPVPSATVRLEVRSSSYSFTVVADDEGMYCASLPSNVYLDGDLVTVNATDGRDYAEEIVHAYEEDGNVSVDLVLTEGAHHNVELEVETDEVDVEGGAAARLNVTLVSTGTRNATVDLSVSADGWAPRLLHRDNDTLATTVHLPVGERVDLLLTFDVPSDAKGDSTMTFHMLAVPREEPDVSNRTNLTARVVPVVAFDMEVTSSPPGTAHPGKVLFYNLTMTNTGNVDDVVDMSYDGTYWTWNVTFDSDSVDLPAFDQARVQVTMNVPDYWDAGEDDIAITGVSRTDDAMVVNAHILVTVEKSVFDVSIVATDPQSDGTPGDSVWWQLRVTNQGNIRDAYDLSVFGLETGWVHRFKVGADVVTQLTLDPLEDEAVVLEVDIPSEFSAMPEESIQFTAKATSVSDNTKLNNTILTLDLEGLLDLTILVDTSTNSPVVGKRVTFTVTVTNLGPHDAAGVIVFAYFGTDVEKKTVGSVPFEEPQEVEFEWLPFSTGPIEIEFVVNPPDEATSIWELTYENNDESYDLVVEGTDEGGLLENLWFWVGLILVLIVIFAILVAAYSRGGDEEEEYEGEYYDEDASEDEPEDVSEEEDEEGWEDEDLDEDEEPADEEEEPLEVASSPAPQKTRPKQKKVARAKPAKEGSKDEEAPDVPLMGGRM